MMNGSDLCCDLSINFLRSLMIRFCPAIALSGSNSSLLVSSKSEPFFGFGGFGGSGVWWFWFWWFCKSTSRYPILKEFQLYPSD